MKPPPEHPSLPGLEPQPRVVFTSVMIPQPGGGVLVKPGKPVILGAEVRVKEFARQTGLSVSRVNSLCQEGRIASRRLTTCPGSPYIIPREELERYLQIGKIESNT